MLAGADPNVGRIAGAVGASPARFDPARLDIAINGRAVVRRGAPVPLGAAAGRSLLDRSFVAVRIDLHAGRCEERMWTCDLTEDYVRINARYTT